MATKISKNQVTQLEDMLRTTLMRVKDGTLRIGGIPYSARTFKQVEEWYVQKQIGSGDFAKQARWDLFGAVPEPLRNRWLTSVGYNDSKKKINDSHIDAALKQALKNL